MSAVDRYTKTIIERRGWQSGSSLENRFVARFSSFNVRPSDLVQQHQVGRYRIDFADPDVLMGIEADGFFHQMPGAAERDRERDAWLLAQGWYLIRIADHPDDEHLAERLLAAVLLIREERVFQGLTWERVPKNRRTPPRPSRLAIAAGYLPEVAPDVLDTVHGVT